MSLLSHANEGFSVQRCKKFTRCHYCFVGKHCIGEGSHVTTRKDLFSSSQALTTSLSPELHLLLAPFFNHPPLPSFCGLLHKARRKENFQTKNGLGKTRANFSTLSGKFIPLWSTFLLSILSLRFCQKGVSAWGGAFWNYIKEVSLCDEKWDERQLTSSGIKKTHRGKKKQTRGWKSE